jgi:hypothetical protein
MLGTWCWIDPPRNTAGIVIFCICHQLVSSDTPTKSIDLRSPLFLTVCSYAFWDFQTLLRNLVVIKVVFGPITKHGMRFEWIKMKFVPPR